MELVSGTIRDMCSPYRAWDLKLVGSVTEGRSVTACEGSLSISGAWSSTLRPQHTTDCLFHEGCGGLDRKRTHHTAQQPWVPEWDLTPQETEQALSTQVSGSQLGEVQAWDVFFTLPSLLLPQPKQLCKAPDQSVDPFSEAQNYSLLLYSIIS